MSVQTTQAGSVARRARRHRSRSVFSAITGTWEGRVGLLLGVAMVLLIVLGPHLAPFPPDKLMTGLPLSGPSSEHLFGTDNLGRDVFSRFLAGGTLILAVPIAAVALAVMLGGLSGMLGAYRGGWVDTGINRTFDILLTLPPLLIALSVIAGLGTSALVLIMTIGVLNAPQVGKVARGATMGAVTSEYIAAAQARGERPVTIIVREVAPNIMGPMIADTALRLTYAVITVATLNFLGLGAQPPSPDWGLSIANSLGFIVVQPWATVAPAAGIAALSVSLNLMADAIARHITNEPSGKAML